MAQRELYGLILRYEGNTMTKRITYLFAMIVLLTSLSATLIAYEKLSGYRNEETSDSGGQVIREVKVDIDGMYPGKSEDVVVSDLNPKAGASVYASFRGESSLLSDSLVVTIKANDLTLTKGLKDVLNKDEIELGKEVAKVTLTYTLPLSVDNSTQNQSASFYVDLISK